MLGDQTTPQPHDHSADTRESEINSRSGNVGSHLQIADLRRQIASLADSLADRERQLDSLRLLVSQGDRAMAVITGSTSWRITRPLRDARRMLRRWRASLSGRTAPSPPSSVAAVGAEDGVSLHAQRGATQAETSTLEDPRQVPKDFDPDFYLKLYPDVAASGLDPGSHYLNYGRREGRLHADPSDLDVYLQGVFNIRTDRESILVVSHEASRTGAPILSLNLARELADRYNVVVLLMGDGPLTDAFVDAGAAALVSSGLQASAPLAELVVGRLHGRFNFKFALVNSIESRAVLPALASRFVPAVSLVHEFAAYTRPREAMTTALFWSRDVVFSANVTRQSALQEIPELEGRPVHVLPQGRCLLPPGPWTDEQWEDERERVRRVMRPTGSPDGLVVVIGAGSIQLRKGVELFIECAARVVSSPAGANCRFVWFGSGYEPDRDVAYSAYLADQIQRAGLEKHLVFAGETPAIEIAYKEADLFVLSSRLDPLPNVAIDALVHGLPVLCFDRASGIAEFLKENGFQDRCVARYLDTAHMADQVLALSASASLRHQVGARAQETSSRFFKMKDYVERLEVVAQGAASGARQEKEDAELIVASGLYRADFSVPPYTAPLSVPAAVRMFVRGWASGIRRRKPCPGFHPGIYLDEHGVRSPGSDPTADYIRAGRPEGPWNYPVIVADGKRPDILPENKHIALHLHIFYPDLLPGITARLSRNRLRPDLFVSVPDEAARDLVAAQLQHYQGDIASLEIVPNRGRDIAPLLTGFGGRILAKYDFVGHLHTKKTLDVKDAAMGKAWYEFLLDNLLSNERGPMADTILSAMHSDASLGMVFPDDPYVVDWNANKGFAEPLAARMGVSALPRHFIFPVGTMFWARTSALAPLVGLNLRWNDYPAEPLPYDGTLPHALERLLPFALPLGNLRAATTNVIGVTR